MKGHPLLNFDLQDDCSDQPKHERLRGYLESEMVAGRLKPGDALPSERQFVQALGVARMTVCQALAGLENDGLIRRVQGKGTFVEADVRTKLKRGTDTFALVVPDTRGGFYPSLLHGFEDAAADIHHRTIVCKTDNDVPKQAEVVLQLLDQKVGGVAIVPPTEPPTPAYQIRQLQEQGIPVVFCHRRVEGIAAPLLSLPFHEVGHLAGKTLAEHGHRRVAFFTQQRSRWAEIYEAGFKEGLLASGKDCIAQTVIVGKSVFFEEKEVWASLQGVFSQPNPPTAIFASFDTLAEMIYLLLPKLGLRVPEDVSLVGEGGTWREGAITRRLTSIVVDEIATGRQAISLLHEMRNGSRSIDNNEDFVLPLSLYAGETIVRVK